MTFYQKVYPLTDFQVVQDQFNQDFNYKWQEGTIKGWENNNNNYNYNNEKMYCEICQKQFMNVNTYANHFSGAKHKKMEKIN